MRVYFDEIRLCRYCIGLLAMMPINIGRGRKVLTRCDALGVVDISKEMAAAFENV